MTDTPKLSVLDLVPVRSGQTSGQAIEASLALAKVADEAGFTRYWVAEHHNIEAVASTSPAIMIALLASATKRIRVGSGGVMLPNHAPLVIAEQFAFLEAAFPGRIDLGIGRAPGTDPVTQWALRSGGAVGPEGDPVARFPEFVQQVVAFMCPDGAGIQIGGRPFHVSATPNAVSESPVWLLGSSDYSARLAARFGLPYVFAHHFSGVGTAEALALYRENYAGEEEPRSLLTVNAVVGDTKEEALLYARAQQHNIAAIRTGAPRLPIFTLEESMLATPRVPDDQFDELMGSWHVGTAEEVAESITALAQQFEVDEVMIQPVGSAKESDPYERVPNRERTVRDLGRLLLG
ncbi:LLM class flavin-dependent oxidoreductase [Dermatophilus congolensis]|uniref:Limonene 1,2-monooxygenase n=1 Tax=Dermatophilus congolensis TaxID=1863 RepID=A0AA46BPT5_9MICO|nr:LLM class flavin-dependent oxidoreductase [Dermatophilus congolensis]MBO3143694.1 LLM class flavin-dependent oxidoreductase [Dermatophilus congolensis]MBO3152685.1 LLM class flavin-dependent oxidoreductase [Dermatophilus congolensis]MBO3160305.1 LLM class flavin-dependent oxidoreductase [Dermatophilus congolensis]MBO3163969.1 LLM class flavin-dependent oxidoreductase [Dermatophilus congolensis]MBO3177515.1 LLM class flavin-dependent oxidoreductase [Dermatophilus congolensis]